MRENATVPKEAYDRLLAAYAFIAGSRTYEVFAARLERETKILVQKGAMTQEFADQMWIGPKMRDMTPDEQMIYAKRFIELADVTDINIGLRSAAMHPVPKDIDLDPAKFAENIIYGVKPF